MNIDFLGKKWNLLAVFTSVVIQVLIGYFLGHYYDIRVFMASGYAVSAGFSPYIPRDFSNIFNNPLFIETVPGIGYPPPWPLLMGAIYQLTFNLYKDIFFYNLIIKIPIIVGNIVLAYAVKHILEKLSANKKTICISWFFILFNPFLILTTSAWGQFDTIVALLLLASLYFLYIKRHIESSITLALSISLKPITLPLVLIPAIYLAKNKIPKIIKYYSVFAIIILLFSVAPFFIFNWDTQILFSNWNAHFRNAGAMSPFNLIELFEGSFRIPSNLEIIGLIWLPSVLLVYYMVYRKPPKDLEGLIESALCLTLVFFLTRTWLSEQNINLVIPLFAIIVGINKNFSYKILHLMWIIPLIFMFFNTSFQQLFFLINNNILLNIATFDENCLVLRLSFRFLIVVIWQFLSWKIVLKLKRNRNKKSPSQIGI